MKFLIRYKAGQSIREKKIMADNLDEAEKIANDKIKKWTDIIMIDKTKGKCENE